MHYRITLHTDQGRRIADLGTFGDLDEANAFAAADAAERGFGPVAIADGMGSVYSDAGVLLVLGVYAEESRA